MKLSTKEKLVFVILNVFFGHYRSFKVKVEKGTCKL